MAKSDSFFLRADLLVDNTGTFAQTEIDLGAYVDALGKSVLRIHNAAVSITDSVGNAMQVQASSDSAACQYQLTTQSQTDIVKAVDKSVIATGLLVGINSFSTDEFPQLYHDADVLPQMWTNGYLVATESIYLGGEGSSGWVASDNVTISIVLECTVETMSQNAAMALALSQQ
tara:strand:+ start:78 stop:596 length:519 start_codon:yes stop_codon:yes gene_type:complete